MNTIVILYATFLNMRLSHLGFCSSFPFYLHQLYLLAFLLIFFFYAISSFTSWLLTFLPYLSFPFFISSSICSHLFVFLAVLLCSVVFFFFSSIALKSYILTSIVLALFPYLPLPSLSTHPLSFPHPIIPRPTSISPPPTFPHP